MNSVGPTSLNRPLITPAPADQSHQAAAVDTKPAPHVQMSAQYFSPVAKVDPDTGIAVLDVLDTATGKVLQQYPSKTVVEEYQRQMRAQEAASPPPAGNGGAPSNGSSANGDNAATGNAQAVTAANQAAANQGSSTPLANNAAQTAGVVAAGAVAATVAPAAAPAPAPSTSSSQHSVLTSA